MGKRVPAAALLAVMVFCLTSPALASDTEYVSRDTFWNWAADNTEGLLSAIISYNAEDVCTVNEDGRHRASTTKGNTNIFGWELDHYVCTCDACGKQFQAYETDVKQSYAAGVEELPASGYNSAGRLIWRPTESDFLYVVLGNSKLSESRGDFTIQPFGIVVPIHRYSGNSVDYSDKLTMRFKAPVSGSYFLLATRGYSYYALHQSGETSTGEGYFSVHAFHQNQGAGIDVGLLLSVLKYSYIRFECYFPVFEIIPDDAFSGSAYDITSRPTSISGGNYGIVGDNGQITKVEDNSTIINETNNTYYNPATGQTVPITDWSYNYEDRSYTVTTENGDTASVTYGDESITITENTTVVEGDTTSAVTNNYTIYYIADGSGSGSHTHDWQESGVTDPTCALTGKKTYTCSCGQTRTEAVPALGHDWQVKQTVTTQYDDTGQLTQQGYTLFECSRCHEQYKSQDGTLPPGGGPGTDPGGDETILDKLPDFAALVLDFFQQLPKLFGGFTVFLTAMFAYIPQEILQLLTFGVAAVVLIGIIKAVRG